jgi:hypothetical protein
MWEVLKNFWVKYEAKIMLCVSLILVATISFEFGYMQGKEQKIDVMVIEKPAQVPKTSPEEQNSAILSPSDLSSEKVSEKTDTALGEGVINQKNCAFVGSKNSNKFYPPSCSYAKRIKPENVVCFASAQEALSRGRIQSTGCSK